MYTENISHFWPLGDIDCRPKVRHRGLLAPRGPAAGRAAQLAADVDQDGEQSRQAADHADHGDLTSNTNWERHKRFGARLIVCTSLQSERFSRFIAQSMWIIMRIHPG